MNARRAAHTLANLAGVVFFSLFCVASLRGYQQSHSILSLGIIAVNSLMLVFYCLHRQPNAIIAFPFAWLVGFAGTLLPLLLRPGEAWALPWLAEPGRYLQAVGLAAISAALLSLKRSFGIVAANRGIQQGGFYRIVRHPLYASELLFFCGYALANQSLGNCLALLAIGAAQYSRIRIEENFLSADPAYARYKRKTRYRLIPGVL